MGQRPLRNRIALTSTTTNYGARNRVTDRWISFLAERAKGGAGMIVTEIVAVDPAALCQASTVTGYESRSRDGGGSLRADPPSRTRGRPNACSITARTRLSFEPLC
jgi:hypothetical protein